MKHPNAPDPAQQRQAAIDSKAGKRPRRSRQFTPDARFRRNGRVHARTVGAGWVGAANPGNSSAPGLAYWRRMKGRKRTRASKLSRQARRTWWPS